ncbi:MAG: zinc ribbon domain-containing protein [Acidimicrobiales bacterium]
MESCPACGATTEAGDRFCAACGDALAGPSLVGERDSGWATGGSPDEPELLLLEPVPPAGSVAEQRVRPERRARPRRSPRMWLVVAAGVAATAVALWGIGRSNAESGGSEDAARSPTTTAAPILPPDPTDAPGSTDTAGADIGETVPTYDRETGGPVLGQPVGWSLLVGRTYDVGLERIDLDSGQSIRFDGMGGAPVALIDGQLVLQVPAEGGGMDLRAVPLSDPTAEGTELVADSFINSFTWPVFPGGDGDLWIYAATADSTTWRLVRVSDGQLIDEVPAPSLFQVGPLPSGGPDVATSPSGGLYRRDGSGYRLLHPARPILISRGAVLVVGCTRPDACFPQWVDVERGEPVDRPLPPDDGGIDWAGTADAAGRFLVGWRSGATTTGALVLYDTGRQRLVEVGAAVATGEVAATPDGRYLAVQAADHIRIFDADQGRWVAVPGREDAGQTGLLFVPNGEDPG